MTPLDLLQSLKAYCEEKTGDMQLLARVSENGTESATRPPKVFIGNLPDKEAEKKEAPYILLKFLTGKNEDEERKCMVRIICVTFSEDKQENYIQCLNVISRIETALLQDVVIANRYSCQKPVETIVYDDDLEVYQIGEIMTTWEMPQVALFNCGKVYAQYGGLLAKREVENNVLLKAGISGIGIYEANSYLIKSLGEDYINNSILANGKSSFSLYNSSISSEYIDLIVSYKVKFKVPFVELPVIPIVQRCRFHTWSGKNVKENSNTDTIVYITPTGSVYHKSQSCTYLRLSISKVLFDNVKNLRNDSGGKYYPCERCLKKEAADESVYISKTGSKYHKNLDCSELKRTVISVELETVKDSKKACNRCAN